VPKDESQPVDLLITAAVANELRPFATRLGLSGPLPRLSRTEIIDCRIALLAAGIGRSSDAAFDAALQDLRPAAVLNVGVAGSLHPDRPAGTAVLVNEWRQAEPPHDVIATADIRLREAMAALLAEELVPWFEAAAVTVDRGLHDPDERDLIHAGSGAYIVEMEGGAWAQLAAARGIPFAALRVISDHANRPLFKYLEQEFKRDWVLNQDGSPRKGRVLWALLSSGAWRRPRKDLKAMTAAGQDWAAAFEGLGKSAEALTRRWPEIASVVQVPEQEEETSH
jgi:nucleoside phosphorylase